MSKERDLMMMLLGSQFKYPTPVEVNQSLRLALVDNSTATNLVEETTLHDIESEVFLCISTNNRMVEVGEFGSMTLEMNGLNHS